MTNSINGFNKFNISFPPDPPEPTKKKGPLQRISGFLTSSPRPLQLTNKVKLLLGHIKDRFLGNKGGVGDAGNEFKFIDPLTYEEHARRRTHGKYKVTNSRYRPPENQQ